MPNGVGVIFDEVLDPELGVVITIPIQYGSDSGIQRFIEVNVDADGNPLINGNSYTFSVTSYFYQPVAGGFPRALRGRCIRERPKLPDVYRAFGTRS